MSHQENLPPDALVPAAAHPLPVTAPERASGSSRSEPLRRAHPPHSPAHRRGRGREAAAWHWQLVVGGG